MNLNQLILTGANYKVVWMLPSGNIYPILTAEMIDWDESSEGETIHAVGEEDPIAEQSNANKYSGKFSLQTGELTQILRLEGLNTAIAIRNSTIAITGLKTAFKKTFAGVNINKSSGGAKNKDKQTLTGLDYAAISISGL